MRLQMSSNIIKSSILYTKNIKFHLYRRDMEKSCFSKNALKRAIDRFVSESIDCSV